MKTKKKTRAPYGSVKAAREAAAAAKAASAPVVKQDFSGAIATLETTRSDAQYNLKHYTSRRDSEQKQVDICAAKIAQLEAAIELLKSQSATPEN